MLWTFKCYIVFYVLSVVLGHREEKNRDRSLCDPWLGEEVDI